MNCVRVRIRATGQVLEMVPDVAAAMITGGTAERVDKHNLSLAEVVPIVIETMTVDNEAEHTVAGSQAQPAQKKRKK